MSVARIEIIVEEPSMEAALDRLMPRLIGDIDFEIYPHSCKSELLRRLPQRLHGYHSRCKNDPWFREHCRVVVLIDRDDEDCAHLKFQLEALAAGAGLRTRSSCRNTSYFTVNRLAIEELEAWYFGDWQAVRAAYPKVPASIPLQARYRAPDQVHGGTWEALLRVLQKAGYFKGGLRKLELARAVAVGMDPARNTSPSFCAFRDVLKEMAEL